MYRQGIARVCIGALAIVVVLLFAAAAGAANFKELGKAAPHVGSGNVCGDCNTFQLSTAPTSPSYVVPKGKWKVVSWESHGPKDFAGHARLRIYRPTGETNQFELVAESDVERFPAGEIKEHKASIRVKKGDHLGIKSVGDGPIATGSSKNQDATGGTAACAFSVGSTVGPMGSGSDCNLITATNFLANVGVTLKRR